MATTFRVSANTPRMVEILQAFEATARDLEARDGHPVGVLDFDAVEGSVKEATAAAAAVQSRQYTHIHRVEQSDDGTAFVAQRVSRDVLTTITDPRLESEFLARLHAEGIDIESIREPN